jgi:hypothetical protein
MAEGKFISYLRVSTDKQGKSGLGIEAQRQAVERYLSGGRWTVAAEYVETESGRRSDRPKLAAALAHAKAIKAKLVFAKLDRLTRNVDLLRSLVASDVDLDGRTALQEFNAGNNSTDPNRSDTDGDGLNDGAEFFVGTNPNKADTDVDSLSDGDEDEG